MAAAGRAGCTAGTRELPRPEVALLGTTEFGFSPLGLKCHCSREQEFKVVAPVGNGLCPPLPPRAEPEVADMDDGREEEPGMRGTTTINRGSTA